MINLRFIEYQYSTDPQLEAILEMVKTIIQKIKQSPHHEQITFAVPLNDFLVKDKLVWMDDKLVLTNSS